MENYEHKFQELYGRHKQSYLTKLGMLRPDDKLSLLDYEDILRNAICRWDGTKLNTKVDYYDHPGGLDVKELAVKQWLSKHCDFCKYDWSVNKLGINQSI